MLDTTATQRAILQTVLYSDLFDYPLSPAEIAHYLMAVPGGKSEIHACLEGSSWLDEQIARVDGFVTLRGREDLIRRRKERADCSKKLWRRARFFARILSCLPFVRMIGVTGALSMDNSDARDDVDVMIVTVSNRVWSARAMSLLIVRAGRLGRNTLCPNYLLSEDVLQLPRRSLYIAHEFVQMVPLYGLEIYERMRAANRWIEEYLPNALRPFKSVPEVRPGPVGRAVKRALERLLGGRLGDRVEEWEMRRKLRKFHDRLATSSGAAILDKDQVKGHFEDHGEQIIRAFQRRLAHYHLTDPDRVSNPEATTTGEPERERAKGVCVPG